MYTYIGLYITKKNYLIIEDVHHYAPDIFSLLTMLYAAGTFMTCVLVSSHTLFCYRVNAILGHRNCSQTQETSWFLQHSHIIHNYSACIANWQD